MRSTAAPPEAASTGALRPRVEARDPYSLLPGDVLGVLRLDVAALFDSAWARDLLMAAIARRTAQPAVVQRFLERTTELVIGMRAVVEGEPRARMIVIFQGQYAGVETESAHPGGASGEHRGHPLLVPPGANTVSLLLDDHTAISGDTDMVNTALDVVDGLLPARGPESQLVRDATERVGMRRHTFSWVTSVRAIQPARGNPIADAPQLLAFWTDLGHTVDAGGFLTFTDPGVASLYMQAVDVALPELVASPRVAELGLGAVLQRLVVHLEEGELRAQLTLGPDETAHLVRVLETLIDEAD